MVEVFFETITIFLALMAIICFIGWLHDKLDIGWDDTDDVDKRIRSGVKPITDHKTGLQYLKTPFGGITPRLDADGKHMRISTDG